MATEERMNQGIVATAASLAALAGGRLVRDWECLACGHKWTQEVNYGPTPNISGELSTQCSRCNGRTQLVGSPQRVEAPSRTVVCICTRQDGEPAHYIGQVAVDDEVLGEGEALQLISEKWAEWRDAVEYPDSDSEFADWLEEQPGFHPAHVSVVSVVLEV